MRARAVDEVARGDALLAFELNFEQAQRGGAAARDCERVAARLHYHAGLDLSAARDADAFALRDFGAPDDEAAFVVGSVRAGPRLEAAHAAFYVARVERPVDEPVLAFEYRRERRVVVALRERPQLSEARERLTQKLRARVRKAFEELRRGLAVADCRRALQQY